MKNHIVIENQSLLDIALMYFGNIDSVFDIINGNDFLYGFSELLKVGDKLNMPENSLIENKDIKQYFSKKQTQIATINNFC